MLIGTDALVDDAGGCPCLTLEDVLMTTLIQFGLSLLDEMGWDGLGLIGRPDFGGDAHIAEFAKGAIDLSDVEVVDGCDGLHREGVALDGEVDTGGGYAECGSIGCEFFGCYYSRIRF